MNWIKERLSEPSTWTSAAVLVMAFGSWYHWFFDTSWYPYTITTALLLALVGFCGHDKDKRLF